MRYSTVTKISFLAALIGGAAFMDVACGGTSDNPGTGGSGTGGSGTAGSGTAGSAGTGTPTGGSAGTSGGTAGTGGTGMTGPAPSLCKPPAPWPKGDTNSLVIDDFAMDDEKINMPRSGVWTLSTDTGSTGSAITAPAGAANNGVLKSSGGSLHVAGTGFGGKTATGTLGWGAAVVVALNKTNTNCPYDASAYGGIKFKLKGKVSQQLWIQFGTEPSIPQSGGGTCSAADDAAGNCYNKYHKVFMATDLDATTAKEFKIGWGELVQGQWGVTSDFSPAALNTIEFAFPQISTAKDATIAAVDFDVEITEMAFVLPGDVGTGGAGGAGGAGGSAGTAGTGGGGAGGTGGEGGAP